MPRKRKSKKTTQNENANVPSPEQEIESSQVQSEDNSANQTDQEEQLATNPEEKSLSSNKIEVSTSSLKMAELPAQTHDPNDGAKSFPRHLNNLEQFLSGKERNRNDTPTRSTGNDDVVPVGFGEGGAHLWVNVAVFSPLTSPRKSSTPKKDSNAKVGDAISCTDTTQDGATIIAGFSGGVGGGGAIPKVRREKTKCSIQLEEQVKSSACRYVPRLSDEFKDLFHPTSLEHCDRLWSEFVKSDLFEKTIHRNDVSRRQTFYLGFGILKLDLLGQENQTKMKIKRSLDYWNQTDAKLGKVIEMFCRHRSLTDDNAHRCNDEHCHPCEVCYQPAIGKHHRAFVCLDCKEFFEFYVVRWYLNFFWICKCRKIDGDHLQSMLDCERCRFKSCSKHMRMTERTVICRDGTIPRVARTLSELRTSLSFIGNVISACATSGGIPKGKYTAESPADEAAATIPGSHFSREGLLQVSDFALSIAEFDAIDFESQNIAMSLSCLEILLIRVAGELACGNPNVTNSDVIKLQKNEDTRVLYSAMLKMKEAIQFTNRSLSVIYTIQALSLFTSRRMWVTSSIMDRIEPHLLVHEDVLRQHLRDVIKIEFVVSPTLAKKAFVALMAELERLQRACWDCREAFKHFDFNI